MSNLQIETAQVTGRGDSELYIAVLSLLGQLKRGINILQAFNIEIFVGNYVTKKQVRGSLLLEQSACCLKLHGEEIVNTNKGSSVVQFYPP